MPKSTNTTALSPLDVLTIILGGGQGTRLFPLTKDRAKPAVPLAGKYRLVDIPISNCLHSELRRVYLLTQFNSASLHRHIYQSYKFDHFSRGFVEILAAEQTLTNTSWYQGTADAVRKNLSHLMNHAFDYLLVLSGDQLYRMDYRTILADHIEREAEVTVATKPVTRKDVPGFGIMRMDDTNRITEFVEKPKEKAVQDAFRLEREWFGKLGLAGDEDLFLASMGIYVFNRKAILDLLDNSMADFGKHIIPAAIKTHRVYAFIFQDSWEDIGTIGAFFEANLDLTSTRPRFNFFDMATPIFTHPRYLPASRIQRGMIESSLVSDGCVLEDATVQHSVIGVRSLVGPGSRLYRTVMMGSDYYEPEESKRSRESKGLPKMGIGKNTTIENAIIDKNACIGDNCVISPKGKDPEVDHPLYFIRDGVIVIPKNGTVPNGTVI